MTMETAVHPLAKHLAELDHILSNHVRRRLTYPVPSMLAIALSIPREVRHV
jgi:hypothetical protein